MNDEKEEITLTKYELEDMMQEKQCEIIVYIAIVFVAVLVLAGCIK